MHSAAVPTRLAALSRWGREGWPGLALRELVAHCPFLYSVTELGRRFFLITPRPPQTEFLCATALAVVELTL